jgi:Protein of unknown function (DUF664)
MTASSATKAPTTGERADLLDLLATCRHFLRFTARDLTDEQAAAHPTTSQLCVGGVIKHVSRTEAGWAQFILDGPSALVGEKDWTEWGEVEWAARAAEFQMMPGETLAGLLDDYAEVARRTDELLSSVPDLDASHPLPKAPWFEPGGRRSARQVFLHIAAETAQHAGHADIIRETIDGAKSMG